ncbi:hypothetical protein BDQ94DRAFT_141442, partial [Aspergillus welwitschiae]
MEFTYCIGRSIPIFLIFPISGSKVLFHFTFFSLLPVLIRANDLTWTPWLLLFRLLSVPHKLTGRGTEAWKVDYGSAS